jgi:hypothetical protein
MLIGQCLVDHVWNWFVRNGLQDWQSMQLSTTPELSEPLRFEVRSFQTNDIPESTMAICLWNSVATAILPCGFIFVSFSVI